MVKPSSKKTSKKASADAGENNASQELPEKEVIEEHLKHVHLFASDPRFALLRSSFLQLKKNVPQVLLLEGGSSFERLQAAHFWSLLINCPLATEVPCLSCTTCSRMVVHLHRDFFFLDGSAGSIKIDDVRSVKGYLGEPPREASWRIVLFREAQAMAAPAANALLKSLEEPQPSTSFLLLAPQRERLLPTLVSRSLVLTLPWARQLEATEETITWAIALCKFIVSGREWFSFTGVKGAVDIASVNMVISLVRHALTAVLRGKLPELLQTPDKKNEELYELIGELTKELSKIPFERLRYLDEVLAEAQECAIIGANPALILDWLVTRIFLLRPPMKR